MAIFSRSETYGDTRLWQAFHESKREKIFVQ